MSYRDLKSAGLDTTLGNAMVELDRSILLRTCPMTVAAGPGCPGSGGRQPVRSRPVPYFCVGPNTKLLGYWGHRR